MDIRINEVQTDVSVVDPRTLLTPAVRDEIVRAVLAALAQQQREAAERRADTQPGSRREAGG